MLDIEKTIKINSFFDGNEVLFKNYDFDYNATVEKCMSDILSISIEEIVQGLIVRKHDETFTASDFPLMSSLHDATVKIVETLDSLDNIGIDFKKLGSLLREIDGTDMANTKYGESHAKVAEMLGLVVIQEFSRKKVVFISNAGHYYLTHPSVRDAMLVRLMLRTKTLGFIVSQGYKGSYEVNECMTMLSNKTLNRRLSVIKSLVQYLENNNEYDFESCTSNLKFTYLEV